MNVKIYFVNVKIIMSLLKVEKLKIVRNLDFNSLKFVKSFFMNFFKIFYQRGVIYIKKRRYNRINLVDCFSF